MKYDIKNILLGVLILISAFFFYKWYFAGDPVAKAENKKLKEENKQLRIERQAIEKKNDSITAHYVQVENNVEKTLDMINSLHVKFGKLEVEVLDSRKELDNTQKEISALLKQIEYLKAHPNKRTGDDLLNSLSEKINKK